MLIFEFRVNLIGPKLCKDNTHFRESITSMEYHTIIIIKHVKRLSRIDAS